MPPKRKRTTADESIAAQGNPTSTTRSTRSSSRNTGATTQGSTAGGSNGVAAPSNQESPPAKKTRKTMTKTSKASTSRSKAAQKHGVITADARTEDHAHKLPDDNEGTATSSVHTNGTAASKNMSTPNKKPAPTKPKKAADRAPQFDPYSPPQATSLFATYADPDDPGVIGPEGFEKLCNDTKISLEGALPLVLAWQMGATEMAKITREEWEKGSSQLRISSLEMLSLAVHDLEDLLLLQTPAIPAPSLPSNNSRHSTSSTASQLEPYNRSRYYGYSKDTKKAFGELYLFCFTLAKPPQGRNIDMETACAFWTVLVAPRYPLLQEIIEFINVYLPGADVTRPQLTPYVLDVFNQEKGTYKGVNKDLWLMMLEFCQTVSPNLDDYEADGAWPTLLDDFVAWKKDKTPS